MAEFSLQALHDEIEADPLTLGYKEVGDEWKGDQAIADLINAKSFTIDNSTLQANDVRASVTYDAYNSLAIDEQEWLRWITPGTDILVISADVKDQLTGSALCVDGAVGVNVSNSFWALAQRPDMVDAMLTIIEVPGSRANVLWGASSAISLNQIGAAAWL